MSKKEKDYMKPKYLFGIFALAMLAMGGIAIAGSYGAVQESAHGSLAVRLPALSTTDQFVEFGDSLESCPCTATYSVAAGNIVPDKIHHNLVGWGVDGATIRIMNSMPTEQLVIIHAQGMRG